MKPLGAGTALAVERPHAAPVFLLRIDFTAPQPGTLRLSDRYVRLGADEYLPLVAEWGNLESVLNSANVDGRPATAEVTLLNTKPIAGKPRLSDLIRSPFNVDGAFEWAFAKATVSQVFEGLDGSEAVVLGVFYLEEPTHIGEDRLAVRMSDQSLVLEDQLRVTRITEAEFTAAQQGVIGRSIPRPFGTLTDIPAIPVVDGAATRLAEGITATDTAIEVDDASDLEPAGTVQIELEHLAYTGKSGNTLTGVTRGANGTTAEEHPDGATVLQVRSGTNAYRFVVGENAGDYRIKSVTNVRINGRPARTSPVVDLDAELVPGKRFATISFTPTNVREFHVLPVAGEFSLTVNSFSVFLDNGQTEQAIRSVPIPATFEGGGKNTRTLTYRVVQSGDDEVLSWSLARRLAGGTWKVIASGSRPPSQLGTLASGTHEQSYESLATEELRLQATHGNGDGTATVVVHVDAYDVRLHDTAGAGDSTAGVVIGEVTCDVEGLQDDAAGTISGTPNLLLENPHDVTKFILTQLYPGIAPADLGTTWASTRASLASLGYRWAFLLEFDTFSRLRRKLGEQARCALYLEGAAWEYAFLPGLPTADKRLSYRRDVEAASVVVSRTPRTDLRNSLWVYSQRDYRREGGLENRYRRVTNEADLSQPGLTSPLQENLELDFVQDAATADSLARFWLDTWKRPRFGLELTAWWNVLALDKLNYLALDDHPVLAAHTGSPAFPLVFRVIGKTYMPGADHSGRIRLVAVEAGQTPVLANALVPWEALTRASQAAVQPWEALRHVVGLEGQDLFDAARDFDADAFFGGRVPRTPWEALGVLPTYFDAEDDFDAARDFGRE